MAGFNPVGSTPPGSILSGSSGTFYGPGVGNLTLTGRPLSANVNAISVKAVFREALAAPDPARMFTKLVIREILHSSVNTARMNVRLVIREMLMSTYVAPSGGGFVSILW